MSNSIGIGKRKMSSSIGIGKPKMSLLIGIGKKDSKALLHIDIFKGRSVLNCTHKKVVTRACALRETKNCISRALFPTVQLNSIDFLDC